MRASVLIACVAAGVTLSVSFESERLYGQAPRSIWSGVYTDAQARRGEALYEKWCSQCHGADLTGMPLEPQRRFPGGPDRTPSLVGTDIATNYDDLPLRDLVERIRISMPQDRPGVLNRQQTVDVVAYLLLQGGFPLGPTELTPRVDELEAIKILSYKPRPGR